jgi:drug/metabolite transporter (DMT)-like permease
MQTPSPADPTQSPASRAAAVNRGVLWMILATMMFVGIDAVAKHLTQSFPVLQVVWARYVFHLVLLAAFLGHRIPQVLKTRRLGLQLVRSALLVITTGLMVAGLSQIPMADASALLFLTPILVTALSMPLLKERVGPRRWISVAVGFVGALIIIRPGSGLMQAAALFPAAAAFFFAFYQITTRQLASIDAPLTTLLYSALVGAAVTSAAVPFQWVAPGPEDWLLMMLTGLLGGLGHFLLIKAFSAARAATVAPFNYSSLIWAMVFGFAFFGDLPDMWTVTGATVIAGSGLYILHRERQRLR